MSGRGGKRRPVIHGVQIRVSFAAAAAVMLISGRRLDFLVLLASLTAHELTHVFTARRYGGRVDSVRLSALGESAVIRGLYNLTPPRRAAVFLSGPALNAACALLARLLGGFAPASASRIIEMFFVYNIVLCAFNLLPCFPMDGGRLLHMCLGCGFGTLRANRAAAKLGRVTGLALTALGLVQAALFPFNIGLLCVGFYIYRYNKRNAFALTCEFFQALLNKPAALRSRGVMRARGVSAREELPLNRAAEALGVDYITCVLIDGDPSRAINEAFLVKYLFEYGLNGTIGDIWEQLP